MSSFLLGLKAQSGRGRRHKVAEAEGTKKNSSGKVHNKIKTLCAQNGSNPGQFS
jgi:hypothetical protein